MIGYSKQQATKEKLKCPGCGGSFDRGDFNKHLQDWHLPSGYYAVLCVMLDDEPHLIPAPDQKAFAVLAAIYGLTACPHCPQAHKDLSKHLPYCKASTPVSKCGISGCTFRGSGHHFHCNDCDYVFINIDKLKNHVMGRHGKVIGNCSGLPVYDSRHYFTDAYMVSSQECLGCCIPKN